MQPGAPSPIPVVFGPTASGKSALAAGLLKSSRSVRGFSTVRI